MKFIEHTCAVVMTTSCKYLSQMLTIWIWKLTRNKYEIKMHINVSSSNEAIFFSASFLWTNYCVISRTKSDLCTFTKESYKCFFSFSVVFISFFSLLLCHFLEKFVTWTENWADKMSLLTVARVGRVMVLEFIVQVK